MLRSLLNRLRPAPIASRADLLRFLEEQALLVAQKSVIGYCHVKTRLPLAELMRDPPFAEAFERGRWEAFAAVLADLVVATEAALREEDLAEAALIALFGECLARHAGPSGTTPPADLADALAARLVAARQAPPATLNTIAQVGAARVFETLPIHARLRAPDRPAILANVRFLVVALAPYFERRLDRPALAAALRG